VHFYDAERYEYVGRKMEADGDFAIIGSIFYNTPNSQRHSGIHIVEGIQDTDLDGFSDMCDSCPETPSLDLGDADGDGLGDACDLFGDINNDGLINVNDLLQMLDAWGSCPDDGLPCLADLDGDGIVNWLDLHLLFFEW